jgi:cytoskeletal protein CcmA (bactofilin family)
MSTCDFTVTLEATQQPITVKSDTSQCCTINVMNDVDITESSANNTVLVWDTEFNLWVRRLLQAGNISGLSAYIAAYLNDNDITFGANVSIGGTLDVTGDIDLTGSLSVDGDIILKGSTLTLGDGGDVININATVNNHLLSTTTNTFDLGSSSKYWRNLYVKNISSANTISVNNITVVANVDVTNVNTTNLYATDVDITANLDVGTINAADINITNNLTVDGDIILKGDTISLGDGGDVININASINAHFVATDDSTFDLGTNSTRWRNVYADYYYGDGTNLTISKHQTEAAPASLANGQLHYSFSSDKLFIGQTDSATDTVSVEYIGGKLLVDKVANLESVVATLSSGGASLANTIISGILTLSSYPENAALRTKAGGVVEAITGSSGEVFQVAANGSPYFDDLNGGTY